MSDAELAACIQNLLTNVTLDCLLMISYMPQSHVDVCLAVLHAGDGLYALLVVPDGPIVAVIPVDDDAEALFQLEHFVGGDFVPKRATRWANTQRWHILASKRVEKVAGVGKEAECETDID